MPSRPGSASDGAGSPVFEGTDTRLSPLAATVGALPGGGSYLDQMHEFLLMYEDVRRAKSPRAEILEFAQTTYATGADLAAWDRPALER